MKTDWWRACCRANAVSEGEGSKTSQSLVCVCCGGGVIPWPAVLKAALPSSPQHKKREKGGGKKKKSPCCQLLLRKRGPDANMGGVASFLFPGWRRLGNRIFGWELMAPFQLTGCF